MTTPSQTKMGKPAEILLVEDNYGDVLLTTKALRQLKTPHSITVAVDGGQALAMLKREDGYWNAPIPSLILLDINLPKHTGLEILQIIKTDLKLLHIPVIMLTSSRMEMDIFTCYNLRAESYMVKPDGPEAFGELVNTIESLLLPVH